MKLLAILVLAIFLRFYDLDSRFLFTLDEEYQATLAKTQVENFHIILVGVSASSGFYLGSLWTYFTAVWLWLSNLDPLITGYVSSSIGVVATCLVFLVGKKLFDKRIALFASLLYATLPIVVYFDQRYWNPTPVPLLSLIIFYSLTQVKNSGWWWVVFSAAVGLIFHTHLSLLALIPIAIYLAIKFRDKLTIKIMLLSTVTFLFIVSPIIYFEIIHKFSGHNVPRDETTQINPWHKSQAVFNLLGRFFYLNDYGTNADEVQWSCSPTAVYKYPQDPLSTNTIPSKLVSISVVMMLFLFFINKRVREDTSYQILAMCITAITLGFIFYPGLASEYYLLGIFPLFVFVPAIVIKNRLILTMLFGLLIPILGIITVLTNRSDFGMANRKALIKQVMQVVAGEPYTLLEDGNCHHWEGWRYLFVVYGRKPERSSVDNTLGWLYPGEVSTTPVKYNVVVHEERGDAKLRWSNFWKKVTVGGYSASIFKIL